MHQPSLADLSAFLSYDSETGVFRWKKAVGSVHPGTVAGSSHSAGYLTIKISGTRYYAHRLAWVFATGRWPSAEIDHINHSRSDNRIVNLRECTRAQNFVNSAVVKKSNSGYRGVSHRYEDSWRAEIGVNYKKVALGTYDDPRLAALAYDRAAREYYGEFARLNFPNQH